MIITVDQESWERKVVYFEGKEIKFSPAQSKPRTLRLGDLRMVTIESELKFLISKT